jgi:hypothetical protein
MASLRRVFIILAAFIAGNFFAVNVLLAGKVLSDFDNLQHYSDWDYLGGPIVGYLLRVLFGTFVNCFMALIPTILVLIFTETMRIRNIWFYALSGGLGGFLFDMACTKISIMGTRSFCVTTSPAELLIVTAAGVVAGYVFWKIAGNRSGEWHPNNPSRFRLRFESWH